MVRMLASATIMVAVVLLSLGAAASEYGHPAVVRIVGPSGSGCTGWFYTAPNAVRLLITAGHCYGMKLRGSSRLVWLYQIEEDGIDVAVAMDVSDDGPDRTLSLSTKFPDFLDPVYFHGYPGGMEVLATGIWIGKYPKFFDTYVAVFTEDAVIPGASGGPILNAHDEVLGMVWGIQQEPTAGLVRVFFVPAHVIKRVLDELSREKKR